MKFVLSILLISITGTLFATDSSLPFPCKIVQMEGRSTLTTEKPVLVMIHNVSKNDLWLTHPTNSDSGADAGWSSRLEAAKWSALLLDQKDFELACIESKPGHEQQVPCSTVISLCKWSKFERKNKEKGSFWAGENKSISALTSDLEGRGFNLPQAKNEGE